MKTIQLKSHVGPDGVLNLTVPTGIHDSDLDVLLVIDRDRGASAGPTGPDRWVEFVRSTAGSIPDPTFIRHEQGAFESREELP